VALTKQGLIRAPVGCFEEVLDSILAAERSQQ